ncbi:MAG: DUF445 family protein [Treponema sp.]|nr:DUF445 family protein [Treponema sp.]
MMFLLQYILPPVIGAFIGFITNVIAIKMLFRPLKEYRVFGIRIPFTPGILPAQRHKLAENIGAMVERELFTPELLRQRLSEEDVRAKLLESVSRFTGKILDTAIDTSIGGNIDSETADLLNSLKNSALDSPVFRSVTRTLIRRISAEAEKHYPAAVSALTGFLRRDDISKSLEIQGQRIITDVILSLNMFQRLLITAGQYENTIRRQMPGLIQKLIAQAENGLSDRKVRGQVLDFFENFITKNVAASKIPEDLLPGIRDNLLGEYSGQTVRSIFSINDACKQRIDEFACSRLLRLASGEIEGLLKSINIRTMVSKRIDALDMIRVENIILDIMANQFKWIDIFGGILGFIIGLIQIAVNQIIRILS